MQNPIQKCRQSSIVLEKPGILSENLKTLTSSNYPTVQYFLLKLCTRFLLTSVYKRVSGSFFILFRYQVINKNVKNECVESRSFYIFKNQFQINHASHLNGETLQCIVSMNCVIYSLFQFS